MKILLPVLAAVVGTGALGSSMYECRSAGPEPKLKLTVLYPRPVNPSVIVRFAHLVLTTDEGETLSAHFNNDSIQDQGAKVGAVDLQTGSMFRLVRRPDRSGHLTAVVDGRFVTLPVTCSR